MSVKKVDFSENDCQMFSSPNHSLSEKELNEIPAFKKTFNKY
jgi:hypothetical protein